MEGHDPSFTAKPKQGTSVPADLEPRLLGVRAYVWGNKPHLFDSWHLWIHEMTVMPFLKSYLIFRGGSSMWEGWSGGKGGMLQKSGERPSGACKTAAKKEKKKIRPASAAPLWCPTASQVPRDGGRSSYSEAPFHYKIPGPWITLVFIFFIFCFF